LSTLDISKALIASPTFTGTVTLPTPIKSSGYTAPVDNTYIGYITSNTGGVILYTSNQDYTSTSISLPPGVWSIYGSCIFISNSSTNAISTCLRIRVSISPTTNLLDTNYHTSQNTNGFAFAANGGTSLAQGVSRVVSHTTTTTYYLVAEATYSGTTNMATNNSSIIQAVRIA
jgi:hypothetical protein